MSLILNGDTGVSKVQSGVVEDTDLVNAPYKMVLGTAVASTSGTSIDFTGIPSWAKRITVMFNGVSTNGTSNIQVQIGKGSIVTTGYTGKATTGYIAFLSPSAAATLGGAISLLNISGNIWVCSGVICQSDGNTANGTSGGYSTLSGTLDRIRITTVNGTDTFDAGTVNIMYEG